MKTIVALLLLAVSLSAGGILPITLEIMKEVRSDYQNGEIDSYVNEILRGQQLSENDSLEVVDEIQFFFESDQFIETGARYLSSLFNERELDEMKAVLQDSSLRNDPNFGGAAKLDRMMKRLKPHLVKYLRNRTGQ